MLVGVFNRIFATEGGGLELAVKPRRYCMEGIKFEENPTCVEMNF